MKYRIKTININIDNDEILRNVIVVFQREGADDYTIILSGDQYNTFARNIVNEDIIFKLLGDIPFERDTNIYTPPTNVIKLWQAENNFITFMRSLGLSDNASREDIQILCTQLENDGKQFEAIKISINSLALINDITQNGGKWSEITWHNGV